MSSMSTIGDPISRGVVNHEMEIPSSEKEEETSLDRVSLLPNEVALNVLSFFGPKDLATCSKVCRRWRELADANVLWREFIADKELEISGSSVKEYIAAQCPEPGAIFCRSYDDAMLGLEDFFRNIPEGQKGRFRVILSQSNEEITFEHGIDTIVDKMRSPDRDSRFIKTWFLIHRVTDIGEANRGGSSNLFGYLSSYNRPFEVHFDIKYNFYQSDLTARIEKSIEKFYEIVEENTSKFRNKPCKRISLFKKMINYCKESRITLVIGVALGILGSIIISDIQIQGK